MGLALNRPDTGGTISEASGLRGQWGAGDTRSAFDDGKDEGEGAVQGASSLLGGG